MPPEEGGNHPILDAFTDLRSGRNHEDPTVLRATISVGASNLGLERMTYASKHVSHSQLTWGSMWYLRPETYTDALARILDADHDLPFAGHWGDAIRLAGSAKTKAIKPSATLRKLGGYRQ